MFKDCFITVLDTTKRGRYLSNDVLYYSKYRLKSVTEAVFFIVIYLLTLKLEIMKVLALVFISVALIWQ